MGEVIRPLEGETPERIEPREYGARTRRHPKSGKSFTDSEFLEHIRTPKFGREIHSSFFLSVGGVTEPSYECECGFRGFFKEEKCQRCGRAL